MFSVCSLIRILLSTIQICAQVTDNLLISPVMGVLCRQVDLFMLVRVAHHSTVLCHVNIARELSPGLTSTSLHMWAAKLF